MFLSSLKILSYRKPCENELGKFELAPAVAEQK